MGYFRKQVTLTDAGVGGTGKYRGAVVTSVTANTLTCRVLLESHITGERAMARGLAPDAIAGDALSLEVEGESASGYVVVSAHATRHSSGPGSFGLIPDHLSGEKLQRHWATGMMHERSPRSGR